MERVKNMNLPRNIVQIGAPNKSVKVFVEDYVLTYIKQFIKQIDTMEGRISLIVLYGYNDSEKGISYYFSYGAIRLREKTSEIGKLSIEQYEEAKKYGAQYFAQYQIIGFCYIENESPDGFYIYQGQQVEFITGYACFYEKNECMLSFMLKQQESKPKQSEKLINNIQQIEPEIKKRDASMDYSLEKIKTQNYTLKEASARQYYKEYKNNQKKIEKKVSSIWGVLIISLTILVVFRYSASISVADVIDTFFVTIGEQKIPDKLENIGDIIHTEVKDDIVDVENIIEENEQLALVSANTIILDEVSEETVENVEDLLETKIYVIQAGDTLLTISQKIYGTNEKVGELCEYNQITDEDSIQVGQSILLP